MCVHVQRPPSTPLSPLSLHDALPISRFMKAGRMYFFEPGPVTDYRVNDWIIVRTELGVDAARVQILPTDSPLVQVDPPLGNVVRKATVADVLEINKRERMDADAAIAAADMARARNLPIKILGTDWQFDGSSKIGRASCRGRVEC